MGVSRGFVKKIKRYLKAFVRDTKVKIDTKAIEVSII